MQKTRPVPTVADETDALQAFFAGLDAGELPADRLAQVELMRTTGQLLRVITEGLMRVLMGWTSAKNELRLEMTQIRPMENNPFKFLIDPQDALTHLLFHPRPGYLPPLEVVREAFDDIQCHEMALVAGLRAALHALSKREEAKLAAAIEQVIAARDRARLDILDTDLEGLDIASEGAVQRYDSEPNVDDAPIVRYIDKVLMDAIDSGASDIHLEPYEKHCRIRFRQDGLLREMLNPPVNIAARLVARLKVMSHMNITERRVPQDGRIKLKLGRDREIDFRVNTLPTLYGEKVVLRILDASADLIGIDHLGLEPEQKSVFLSAIRKPYGMILVTGPTGLGKTVSLYTALDILNRPEVNISTVEDPVEIRVPSINQVNMNQRPGSPSRQHCGPFYARTRTSSWSGDP